MAPVSNSSAVTCENGMVSGTDDICGTDSTDVNVSIEGAWTVAVSSSGTLNVDVTPSGSGTTSTITDNINIYTNTPNGYQLYLNSTSGSTDIYNNADTSHERNHFIATTGTKASPVSLTSNSWGYSLASSPTTFSKVETSSSASDSLISTGTKTTGSGDDLPVTYGFKADTKLTPGTYTTSVTYTAVAEVPSYTISSVSPNTFYTNDQTNKQVTIVTTTPATELGLGDITARVTDGTNTINLTNCTETTVLVDTTSYRAATCTYPGTLPMGYYNVQLTSSWHNATYTLTNGFRIRDYRTMSNITYMQDMNSDICENTPESTSYASAPTLIDRRGKGNAGGTAGTYKVIKAKDGNCWMADNLNIYNKSILATDSDFASPDSYIIPTPITINTDWNSNVYSPATDTGAANPKTGKKVEVAHGLGQYANTIQGDGIWGSVYYNWTAAVAKDDTTSYTNTGPNTSICPKNWTLPTNGDSNTNQSWAKLIDIYNITNGAMLLSNNTLGFNRYYGLWNWMFGASEDVQGSYGNFWSGTPFGEGGAYSLKYGNDYINTQEKSAIVKGFGLNIRCVAR